MKPKYLVLRNILEARLFEKRLFRSTEVVLARVVMTTPVNKDNDSTWKDRLVV